MKIGARKGKMVLFEGLDAAGKTTVAKEIIKRAADDYDLFYCKGIGSDNFLGRLAKRSAKTSLFLAELVYVTYFIIRPALKSGKLVLQDRYFVSVASHIPDIEKGFNKILMKLARPLFFEPDLIIYFQVSTEERIKRLKMSTKENRFHQILIDNPELIKKLEEKYQELLVPYKGRVIFLDTTHKSIDETVELALFLLKIFFGED